MSTFESNLIDLGQRLQVLEPQGDVESPSLSTTASVSLMFTSTGLSQELDYHRRLLDAGGQLADIAGRIVGEDIGGTSDRNTLAQLPELLLELKQRTIHYNTLVLERAMTQKNQREQ